MSFDDIVNVGEPRVVLFYGTACAPCMRLKPVLRQALSELGLREPVELNVAAELSAARALGLRSVPAVALVKGDGAKVLFTGEKALADLKTSLQGAGLG